MHKCLLLRHVWPRPYLTTTGSKTLSVSKILFLWKYKFSDIIVILYPTKNVLRPKNITSFFHGTFPLIGSVYLPVTYSQLLTTIKNTNDSHHQRALDRIGCAYMSTVAYKCPTIPPEDPVLPKLVNAYQFRWCSGWSSCLSRSMSRGSAWDLHLHAWDPPACASGGSCMDQSVSGVLLGILLCVQRILCMCMYIHLDPA